MSEEKYEERVLKALNLIVEQTKKPSVESSEHVAMPESARGHKTIDEVADCPTCKPKLIEKFRPEILKEQREKLKGMKKPKLCDDCGEVLDGEKEEDCPNCHGHHY